MGILNAGANGGVHVEEGSASYILISNKAIILKTVYICASWVPHGRFIVFNYCSLLTLCLCLTELDRLLAYKGRMLYHNWGKIYIAELGLPKSNLTGVDI